MLDPHHFVPHRGIGDDVSVVDCDLFAFLHVSQGDDALDQSETGVLEQVKLRVGLKGVANLRKEKKIKKNSSVE